MEVHVFYAQTSLILWSSDHVPHDLGLPPVHLSSPVQRNVLSFCISTSRVPLASAIHPVEKEGSSDGFDEGCSASRVKEAVGPPAKVPVMAVD